jgi:hypothetical protein
VHQPDCLPGTQCINNTLQLTSPAKPDIKYLCQGAHGPEPYIKYTIQGAQDGGPAAYLCNYLDNHGSLESTG